MGFVGGTVLLGHSCSALVGGVLAIDLALGEIENSYLQVVKMLWTVSRGGDSMARCRTMGNAVTKQVAAILDAGETRP